MSVALLINCPFPLLLNIIDCLVTKLLESADVTALHFEQYACQFVSLRMPNYPFACFFKIWDARQTPHVKSRMLR